MKSEVKVEKIYFGTTAFRFEDDFGPAAGCRHEQH